MQRARAAINYGPGSPGVITIYTRTTAPENSASAQLTVDRLKDAFTAGSNLFPNSLTMSSESFVDSIDPATGLITASYPVTPWSLSGNVSGGQYLPTATQLCITWKTDDVVAGRRVRGRTFLGPLATSLNQGDGTPTSAAITTALALGAAWIDAGTTDVEAVVWKRPKGSTPGSDHVITSYSVRDVFSVLRSRRD